MKYMYSVDALARRGRATDGRTLIQLRKVPPPTGKMGREIRQGESLGKGPETTRTR